MVFFSTWRVPDSLLLRYELLSFGSGVQVISLISIPSFPLPFVQTLALRLLQTRDTPFITSKFSICHLDSLIWEKSSWRICVGYFQLHLISGRTGMYGRMRKGNGGKKRAHLKTDGNCSNRLSGRKESATSGTFAECRGAEVVVKCKWEDQLKCHIFNFLLANNVKSFQPQ